MAVRHPEVEMTPISRLYGEGAMAAPASRETPLARNALGTALRTTGQHQGRSLIHAEPVSFRKQCPAYHAGIRRVHLPHLHPLTIPTRQIVRLYPAVGKRRQHPATTRRLSLQSILLRREVQPRVDSGRGQNRTLRSLSALWPPVFAGEQDVGPPKLGSRLN